MFGKKFLFLVILSVLVYVFLVFDFNPVLYEGSVNADDEVVVEDAESRERDKQDKFIATHIKTPEPLKAIYITSWVAGTRDWRESLVKMIGETELNSVIIDIKDATGKISFKVDDLYLQGIGSSENRISDIKEFLEYLHSKNIYVIGRISVFQDPYFAELFPDLAVKRGVDGTIWKDYKGISWLDVGAEDVWGYIVAIARESYNVGFDELNFDYIRFPSDGNMYDIFYPFSEERIMADPDLGKAEILKDFFIYLSEALSSLDVVLSADLFGMTTTNADDLNIGQKLEYAEPYFDYLAPMVYPSHYPATFLGFDDPNKYPYEVVKYSMERGVAKLLAASSTPSKLRPWLQDFDYGGDYGAVEVRAQIQAVYDAGLTSWMLWNPSNRYTREALLDSD